MINLREAFSAPFNWCDRKCERCPIAGDCPVWRRELQRRWVHQARGVDPDSPEAVMADMTQDLTSTLRILEECAAEEGIALDEPLPPRVLVLDAERLNRAAMTVVRWLAALPETTEPQRIEAYREARSLVMTLAGKCARIAGYLSDVPTDDQEWARDAAPNLLLLERLQRDLRAALARMAEPPSAGSSVARALDDLDRILTPLIADLGEPVRALLVSLEERGAAPSPFLRGSNESD